MKVTALCSTTALLFLSGCASTQQPQTPEPSSKIYHGNGAPCELGSILSAIGQADIILVGEHHNDSIAHSLELQFAEALLDTSPDAAVAMEMFERDEQGLVDLYLDGHISAASLIKTTGSINWGGGKNTWNDWYQPIVDTVKAHRQDGAALIAANAPRNYVKLARMEGFEPLKLLQMSGNQSYTLPDATDDSAYKQRFVELMTPENGGTAEHMMHIDPEAFFRSQQVWDASMAASVVRAKAHHSKVILFVGDFHIAHQGGTFLRIREALPVAKILTISIRSRADNSTLACDDHHAADFIIYTAL